MRFLGKTIPGNNLSEIITHINSDDFQRDKRSQNTHGEHGKKCFFAESRPGTERGRGGGNQIVVSNDRSSMPGDGTYYVSCSNAFSGILKKGKSRKERAVQPVCKCRHI